MDKSPEAFRTISEVAEDLDLPQHVLRFWETRFPQIKPLKRGGGRRYYRPGDVDLLKGIRHLLYGEGYTIKGVQRILKTEGVRAVEGFGRGEAVLARQPPPSVDPGDDEVREEYAEEAGFRADHGGDRAGHDDGGEAREAALAGLGYGHAAQAQRAALDIGQLRAALDELRECQRVLKALREPEESGLAY